MTCVISNQYVMKSAGHLAFSHFHDMAASFFKVPHHHCLQLPGTRNRSV